MPETLSARYTDGQTAREHAVNVRVSSSGLAFEAGGTNQFWPTSGLKLVERANGQPRLAHDSFGEARLLLDDSAAEQRLMQDLPDVMTRSGDRLGLDLRKMALLGGSTLALIVILIFSLPALVGLATTLVPLSYEKELGQQTLGALGRFMDGAAETCSEPEGQKVLADMTAQLVDGRELRVPIEVRVVPVDLVNAVALPGGFVLIFDGLLQKAESPEEVAGVLAHEIGHTQFRHGMQRLIYTEALSVFINIIASGQAGSVIGDAGALLASLSYSRDAEREADVYAIETLNRINVRSDGMAEFFERAPDAGESGEEDDAESSDDIETTLFEYLSTHPASNERAAILRAEGTGTDSILNEAEWAALKRICGGGPDEE